MDLKKTVYHRVAKAMVCVSLILGMLLWQFSLPHSLKFLSFPGPVTAWAAPPVADAGDDQVNEKDQPLAAAVLLNGSGSNDPDGSSLTHNWYGPFPTDSGSTPVVVIPEGTYTVSLSVDDSEALSDIDTAVITVSPCFNISARAKIGKVQLTWTHLPGTERYDVYRAAESNPSSFDKIGDTTSTYSTYLDTTISNETSYLYLVGSLSQNTWCYSNVISSHPTAVRSRTPINYNPVIYSSPITHGTVGIIYNYDINATDPNNDRLSYSLLVSPAGMAIDTDTGLVAWTPTEAGSFDVTVETTDGKGETDIQDFTLEVGYVGECLDGQIRPCSTLCGTGSETCVNRTWQSCDAPQPEVEVCDGADNDCDGQVDEGVLNACGTCGPVPEEVCDGIDNNCDGIIDEGVTSTFFADTDGDGFGDPGSSVAACSAPHGFVADDRDCDDTNSSVYPGATEIADNGVDEDCDDVDLISQYGEVWFVDSEAPPSGDGLSWATAFNTIESAVHTAFPDDEIWVKAGEYRLRATVSIDKPLALYAGFAGYESRRGQRDRENNVTTISGEDLVGICLIITSEATLDGFTITMCYSSLRAPWDEPHGAVMIDGASPTLSHCTFTKNRSLFGGAIHNRNASPTISECSFVENGAKWQGGAIYNYDYSSPTISHCEFTGDRTDGTTVFNYDNSSPVITHCLFTGNRGGIGISGNSSPTISHSDFIGNAGGIEIGTSMYQSGERDGSAPIISDCVFTGNLRWGIIIGGYKTGAPPSRITGCRFKSNRGCAISSSGGYAVISGSMFAGNSGTEGGAIQNRLGLLEVRDSVFSGNWAERNGGAIFNERANFYAVNCIFRENHLVLDDGCSRGKEGAAIFNTKFTNSFILFSTFSGNHFIEQNPGGYVCKGGAIYSEMDSSPVIANSIFWGNDPNNVRGDIGSHPTLTYCVDFERGDVPDHHNITEDPGFVDPARSDFRLLPDSPAIDTGTADVPEPPFLPPTGLPDTDFEGNARVADGDEDGTAVPDMGAYEYVPDGVVPPDPQSNTAPIARIHHRLDYAEIHVGDMVQFDGSGSRDADGDFLEYRWSLVHAPEESTSALSDPLSATPTLHIDRSGVYAVDLIVHDGQVDSQPDTIAICTRNRRPIWTTDPDEIVVNVGEPVRLRGERIYDPDNDLLMYEWRFSDNMWSDTGGKPWNSRITLVGLRGPNPEFVPDVPGIYQIKAYVYDEWSRNRVTEFARVYAQVSSNNPPVITSTPPAEATLCQTYEYQVTAKDPDVHHWDYPFTYYLDVAPSGMRINFRKDGHIIWTPTRTGDVYHVGEHDVVVRVVDRRAAFTFHEFTITVSDDPPLITSNPVTNATKGELYLYQVRASNCQGEDVLIFALNGAPAGMTIDPLSGLISWTPSQTQAGEQSVTIVVVEEPSGLSASQDFTITVGAANHPPVITSIPPLTATPGIIYYYDVQAADPDPDGVLTFSFTLTQAPQGLSVDNTSGLIQWLPGDEHVGYHDVAVQVQDAGGLTAAQSYSLTVVAANHTPEFHSNPLTEAVEGQLYTYIVQASDPDAEDALIFALATAPQGMNINEKTGVIQWTPTYRQAGDHQVVVIVSDSRGLANFQSFAVTVADTPATSIEVEASPRNLRVPVGSPGSISYVVTFETNSPNNYILELTQSVAPDDGGITFELDLPAEWSVAGSTSWLTSQIVSANKVGIYEVTTTVLIRETGASDQITTMVEVTGTLPELTFLGSHPDALPISQPIDVLFTTRLSDSDQKPSEVILEELDGLGIPARTIGNLFDNGQAGDLLPNDSIYSGTFRLQYEQEGRIHFRTKSIIAGEAEPIYSDGIWVAVTRFPIGISPSDTSETIVDYLTGEEFVAGEVIVYFVDDTAPETIEAIVTNIGGTIMGTLHTFGIYQIQIPNGADPTAIYATIAQLKGYPQVKTAGPNLVGSVDSIEPLDRFYDHQSALQQIRADEAWVMARGDPSTYIAIVDSGVDYNHPDLGAKVFRDIAGLDVTCGLLCTGRDPIDENGHGTMMAGIAAALTNNDVAQDGKARGVAGVAWNNKIIPIKAFLHGRVGNIPRMMEGIRRAIVFGAKIINVSWSTDIGFNPHRHDNLADFIEELTPYRELIDKAYYNNCLVVGSVGNDGTGLTDVWPTIENDLRRLNSWPAVHPHALGVGCSTLAITGVERRWQMPSIVIGSNFGNRGSNYGSIVDIAAPAELITSTLLYDYTDFLRNKGPLDATLRWDGVLYDTQGVYITTYGATSGAAALTSGTAALVWSLFPQMNVDQLKQRLLDTAARLPDQPETEPFGEGSIDVFEAVFNGSFEADEPFDQHHFTAVSHYEPYLESTHIDDPEWNICIDQEEGAPWCATTYYEPVESGDYPAPVHHGWHFYGFKGLHSPGGLGTPIYDYRAIGYNEGGGFIPNFGPIRPMHGEKMAYLSNGRLGQNHEWALNASTKEYLANSYYATVLEKRFYIQPGQNSIDITLAFNLLMEHPENEMPWYYKNDCMQIYLVVDGIRHMVTRASIDSLWYLLTENQVVEGLSLSEGLPVRQTGWISIDETVPVPEQGGQAVMRIVLKDGAWDVLYDTVLLVDNIRFRPLD